MNKLNSIFLKGLLTVLPVIITIFLVNWIFTTLESWLGGLIKQFIPPEQYWPGMGIIAGLVTIFLLGFLMNNFIAQELAGFFTRQIEKVPLIKAIYSPLRDVMHLFGTRKRDDVSRVVLVELPNSHIQVFGLVTRENFDDIATLGLQADSVAVFIPFSYMVGGMTIMVSKDYVHEVDMSVDEAMKLAVTGWVKADLPVNKKE